MRGVLWGIGGGVCTDYGMPGDACDVLQWISTFPTWTNGLLLLTKLSPNVDGSNVG